MNILIPDSWLREFIKTDATPKELKEYLSLCGPSIERVHTVGREIVYDIEVTTNRVDSYSVSGIAREAATILPRFGKKAEYVPFTVKTRAHPKEKIGIHIDDPQGFCRRILAVKISGLKLAPSPAWLTRRLELVGQRPLNNIVDITNYVMWETGHPLHAFDYDRLTAKKIIVREARKGEKVVSLDKKEHSMIGGELVFDDGTGTIIDIPGVMGTANSIVTDQTKNVLLFIENSLPEKIRFTSMTHAIRTQAAVINEKDPDPELALTAMHRAVDLAVELTGGSVGSALYDAYPKKYKPYTVQLARTKLDSYLGTRLSDSEIEHILKTLGFGVRITKAAITATVPSFRRDVTIDADIIEEIARIYGYHTIETHLPSGEPPVVMPDKQLVAEEAVKNRLRDWGYTELYTYSMVSEALMNAYGFSTSHAYKITNPLSADWEYMRPDITMSMLEVLGSAPSVSDGMRVFELSNTYGWRPDDLPEETPMLVILWTGDEFLRAKGLASELFRLHGIPMPEQMFKANGNGPASYTGKALSLGKYGSLGVMNPALTSHANIHTPVTRLELKFRVLVNDAKPYATYQPVPKFPPAIEDLAFVVPQNFAVGPFMQKLEAADPLVSRVTLLDTHGQTRTVHIEYRSQDKNLTSADIRPVREKLIALAQKEYGATLRDI